MKHALAALALLAGCAHARPRPAPLQVEVLLDPPLATARHVGALALDFDVSPRRYVVVADPDHLYAVGWGGVAPVGALPGADSLAYTDDGLLLVVRGDQLLYLDAAGALAPLFALPHAGMALATGGPGVVYLFDRAGGGGRYGLYELAPGRRVTLLLESPRPIDAVAQTGGRLLFASGGAVFEATPGRRMRLVAHLRGAAIRSVAADDRHVYLSDGAAVYALGKDLELVTATAGGTLRVRGGALLVLDPAHHLLLRLAPR